MKDSIIYEFNYIEYCNMCGSNTLNHKVLGKRLNQSQGFNPKKKIGITTTVVKCNNCGLIYSNPQPIPENIDDHYDIDPEEYWKENYLDGDIRYFDQQITIIKSLYHFKSGDKALDIGSGLGKALFALEKSGFDVWGIEPSNKFYHHAISKMNINPDKLKLSTIEGAIFPNDYFDFITFGAVLEHLYDPSESIKKALGWLKPGRFIHVEVPSSDWLINKILNLYYKIRGLDYVANISPMHKPFHLYEFSLNSFHENSKLNNYKIVHFDYYVCDTYAPRIINIFLIPYMKFTNKGMQLSVWLKKN